MALTKREVLSEFREVKAKIKERLNQDKQILKELGKRCHKIQRNFMLGKEQLDLAINLIRNSEHNREFREVKLAELQNMWNVAKEQYTRDYLNAYRRFARKISNGIDKLNCTRPSLRYRVSTIEKLKRKLQQLVGVNYEQARSAALEIKVTKSVVVVAEARMLYMRVGGYEIECAEFNIRPTIVFDF